MQEAGSIILSEEGGDLGQVLRRLHSHVLQFRRNDLTKDSGSVLDHLLVDACLNQPTKLDCCTYAEAEDLVTSSVTLTSI